MRRVEREIAEADERRASALHTMLLAASLLSAACTRSRHAPASRALDAGSTPRPTLASIEAGSKPELLYLPDADDWAPRAPGQALLAGPWGFQRGRCPPDMVDVRGQFCIDRFEASLVDQVTGLELSPYYHPAPGQVRYGYAVWQKRRLETGTAAARLMPVPPPPAFQLEREFQPSARSRAGVVPSGYLSGTVAEEACRNAGKRLCRLDEWQMACRGEQGRKFPYGEQFTPGLCNVARDSHPAAVLHGNPSIHHLDPRLNLAEHGGEPLLRRTGATATCKSRWGDDAVFDMVGNLDEWIDDPEGTFAGGFYSRATADGCDARIVSHDYKYFDYSLGARCCK
jgi:formylglycine-generating enzyme required for sulfatase activity